MSGLNEAGGSIALAAVQVVQGLAEKVGLDVDAATVIRLAGELVQSGVELIDGHAKKKAEAAGDAAAAAITTEDAAEAAQRKP